MTTRYKERAPTIVGIDVSSAAIQAADVAQLLGAVGYTVDVAGGKATFSLPPESADGSSRDITVSNGQIVYMIDNRPAIEDRSKFLEKYEAEGAS